MIAYVTSIGEATTEVSVWSLERLGFTVKLIEDKTTLWDKINRIVTEANEDFLRVDADTIVNKNVNELVGLSEAWWYQPLNFDWFKQDVGHGGVQFIRKPALEIIRKHINEATTLDRPESYLFRLAEFHNPRRCVTYERVCALHGYGQADVERVKQVKARRNQLGNYDFELAERL